MPTAWQMLMKKLNPDPPQSKLVLNPLNARIGSSVQLDVLDFRQHTFFVKKIREISRLIGKENYQLVDYQLLARPLGKEDDVEAFLRLIPLPKASAKGDLSHHCILLKKYDELVFDQGFRDLLDDSEFVTEVDGKETGRYWRINDLKTPYKCTVKTVDEKNEKGTSVDSMGCLLWDYWREHPDEAGQPTKEYLFVEMEEENGYFTILLGEEINAQNVTVA
jgi:hypothetical protein